MLTVICVILLGFCLVGTKFIDRLFGVVVVLAIAAFIALKALGAF
jgi:hypothetical protein